jgi:hypothetical protein
LGDARLEHNDLLVLGIAGGASAPSVQLTEGPLGLIQQVLEPQLNQAGLNLVLNSQVAYWHPVAKMPADPGRHLVVGKVPPSALRRFVHEMGSSELP